jgi:hypothetical protein
MQDRDVAILEPFNRNRNLCLDLITVELFSREA